MAAPMINMRLYNVFRNFSLKLGNSNQVSNYGPANKLRLYQRSFSSGRYFSYADKRSFFKGALGLTVAAGAGGYLSNLYQRITVHADDGGRPPKLIPSRIVKSEADNTGLKLTLYQYQTCPFCCKVRAYLDYHGFSYDVIEVNSVWRQQIKWSKYRKVPILVCEGIGEDGFVQMNDSSVIVSILESHVQDRKMPVDKLTTYYPVLEGKNDRGKNVLEYPNKYFIMFGEKEYIESTEAMRKEERKWRKWTDSQIVHMISPNVYRTPSEALQAFRYFSDIGQWDRNFSTWERYCVIYIGATAMYFLSKYLKKRYALKPDVRESLYDHCREWTKAVNKKGKFMGGDSPNLADLAVYGALQSFEGCEAFQDMLTNTNIGPWYKRTKDLVNSSAGANKLKLV